MARPSRFSPEVRERAVRMVFEHAQDHASQWARHALGVEGVPAVWRALAGNPFYLDATWQKERALMADGRLTALDKRRVGLAVAMNARVRYGIEYHAAVLRHAGGTDADLLEILGVVDHYNSLNLITTAMQIESDIRPPAGH